MRNEYSTTNKKKNAIKNAQICAFKEPSIKTKDNFYENKNRKILFRRKSSVKAQLQHNSA